MVERPVAEIHNDNNWYIKYLDQYDVKARLTAVINVYSDQNRQLLLEVFLDTTDTNPMFAGKVVEVLFRNNTFLLIRNDGGIFCDKNGYQDYREPTQGNIHNLSSHEMYLVDRELLVLEGHQYLISQEVCLCNNTYCFPASP